MSSRLLTYVIPKIKSAACLPKPNLTERMKATFMTRLLLVLSICVVPAALAVPTIWTGPDTTFTQASPYPGAGDRDQLTPNVALTRGSATGGGTGGMFNAVTETFFTHGVSPADTQWAVGQLADYATLTYTSWENANGGNPVMTLPGQPLVVHLVSDDIYLALTFTSLPNGPGFSYIRSTPPPPVSVTITNPVDNAKFGNTDSVIVQAIAGSTAGTVTNVQFFNGTVLLANFTVPPYSFSGTALAGKFALGTNILTAVAKDNVGNTTTSVPVHVIIARYLPPITNGPINILLQLMATNMAAPDYAISPPGDSHRLFVVEQSGLLRIIQDGVLLPGSALDISGLISTSFNPGSANDERGFLGLAFHPGFNNPASPGYRTLYTYSSQLITTGPTYVAPNAASQGYQNTVNEWKISNANSNVVDAASRREIISFGKNANNHNGGTITFGPDGYMYLGLGDGGNANDVGASHIEPGGNAQNLSTPLGKMLRIDPLNPALNPGSPNPVSANGQYRIPTSNPFQGVGQVPEIYAYGLRNPYRFSFDRVNGDLIQADVGQNNIEEIDRIVLGGNFGWAIKEGDFLFNRTNGPAGPAGTIGAPPGNRSPGSPVGLIDPITGTQATLEYDHNEGISITGGFVYRGTNIPELYGKYIFGDLALQASPVRANGRIFYADLLTGEIKALPLVQFGGSAILPNGLTVHGFGQDADGELYVLVTNTSANGTGGIVYKLAALRLAFQQAGNQLEISWPAIAGHLEAQTNNLSVGIGANWTTVPGSAATNRVVVPLNPANGSVFYRLAVP